MYEKNLQPPESSSDATQVHHAVSPGREKGSQNHSSLQVLPSLDTFRHPGEPTASHHPPQTVALTGQVHPNFLCQESTKECSLPERKDALARDQWHRRTNLLSAHRSPWDPEQPKPPDPSFLQNSPGRMAQLTMGLALEEAHGLRLTSSHW